MTDRNRLLFCFLLAIAYGVPTLAGSWDTDARFAMPDALHLGAENTPGGSWLVQPHHPLHSLATRALAEALQPMGVNAAGHVATRLWSLFGSLLLIMLIARPRDGGDGLACLFALLLLCTRGLMIETIVGEVLPLSLALLVVAWRWARDPDRPLAHLACVTLLALAWRQDFVLFVPALVLAQSRHGRGRAQRYLAICGFGALGFYAAVWAIFEAQHSFAHWLTQVAHLPNASWAPAAIPGGRELLMYLASAGAAIVGWQPTGENLNHWPHALLGMGFFSVLATCAWMGRSSRKPAPDFLSLAAAFLVPNLFYLWFEPSNFEWWLPTIVLAVTIAADATRRVNPSLAPQTARFSSPQHRQASGVLLAALSAAVLSLHLTETCGLVQRDLAKTIAVAHALAAEREEFLIVVQEPRVGFALDAAGLGWDRSGLGVPPAALARDLMLRAAKDPRAGALVLSRGLGDGSPAFRSADAIDPWARWLDHLQADDRTAIMRDDRGRVVLFAWNLGE